MITVMVSGPDGERAVVAKVVQDALMGSRYTVQRFGKGQDPPKSAQEPQVRILEIHG